MKVISWKKDPLGFRVIHLPSVLSVSFDSLAPARLALRANLRMLFLQGSRLFGCG